MKRFRYACVSQGQVDGVNRLLAEGWKPVRETPMNAAAAAGEGAGADMLVVLERDDAFPLYRGVVICDGAPTEFFDDIPLFAGFGEEELREMLAACQVQSYAEGAVIFEEGNNEQRIYIVLEGQVAIQLMGLPIDDPVVLEAGPKDVFGESTFFAPAPHTTRAMATSPTRTLELTRTRYEELLQGHRSCAYKLGVNAARTLGERLQATDAWVREILQGEQTSDVVRSWKRYRRGIHGSSRGAAGGFFSM